MAVITSYNKDWIDNNLVNVSQIGTLYGPQGETGPAGTPGASAEIAIVTTQAEADAVPPGTVAIIRNPA